MSDVPQFEWTDALVAKLDREYKRAVKAGRSTLTFEYEPGKPMVELEVPFVKMLLDFTLPNNSGELKVKGNDR